MVCAGIGDNVRRLRAEAGLSQEQLAALAGLSSVKMIETGKRNPSVGSLNAIAAALSQALKREVTAAILLGGADATSGR